MSVIAELTCELDNDDRLTVERDSVDGRYGFKMQGTSVWIGPERAREFIAKVAASMGDGPAKPAEPAEPMPRAEALEAAIAHVTKMTTNDRGYGTVSQTERGAMTLRFAAFLLGE